MATVAVFYMTILLFLFGKFYLGAYIFSKNRSQKSRKIKMDYISTTKIKIKKCYKLWLRIPERFLKVVLLILYEKSEHKFKLYNS